MTIAEVVGVVDDGIVIDAVVVAGVLKPDDVNVVVVVDGAEVGAEVGVVLGVTAGISSLESDGSRDTFEFRRN